MGHICKYKIYNSKPVEENIGENLCKPELGKISQVQYEEFNL